MTELLGRGIKSACFYNAAALWIAPWSSHVLGPVVLFAFNFWLAQRSPARNVMLFAAATILFYVIVDLGTVPMMGLPIVSALTVTFGLIAGGVLVSLWKTRGQPAVVEYT